VVEQIVQAGVLRVKIGGGEPFSYKPLWEIIPILRKNGISISASTSGITLDRITQDQLDILKEGRVKISLSLDGEPAYHDLIRGHKGLATKVAKGLEILKGKGVLVELRATIFNTRASIAQLDYLDDLSKNLSMRIRIRPARPRGGADFNDVAFCTNDQGYANFFSRVRGLRKSNPFIDITEELDFDGHPDYAIWGLGMDCAAGTRSAFIDQDGIFKPCGFIEKNFSGEGILKERKLMDAWRDGDSFLRVRDYFKKMNSESECSRCNFVNACQGGCPSVRFASGTQKTPLCPIKQQ
jgi:radical SAM protein with 4Fe4S-binding SPASM domain